MSKHSKEVLAAKAAWAREYRKRHRSPPKSAELRKQKRCFSSVKRSAKYSGRSFDLTFEQYVSLVSGGRCFYDSDHLLPAQGGGLDRKNSDLGYSFENCVPCCWACNLIRGHDNITHSEMIEVAKLLRNLRTDLRDVRMAS